MADIVLRRKHSIGKERCINLVEELGEQLKSQFGGSVSRDGDTFRFEAKGARGALTASQDDVVIEITLGLLTRAFRPVIEREIDKACDRYLGN